MAELANCLETPVVSRKKTQEKAKSKQFRWASEMIENLITCIQSFKAQMEYKNIDFDGDRPAQYSWLRKEMAKLYDKETSLFGPVSVTPAQSTLSAMNKEEIEAFTKQNKAETELIKKGYNRIREKVKEIRQSFSQAVVNGTRSGSGKIVYEFYDELVTIWGGAAATKPLSFGVGTDSLKQPECPQSAQKQLVGLVDDDDDLIGTTLGGESEEVSDEELMENRKRKSANQVPNLIDNKRKHLEKTLSAAQRDALLLNEAKEETKFRKNLADATREATSSFSNALKDVNTCMTQLGSGLSRSIEMMAQAVIAQTMANTQARPMPCNQNLFYQSVPNAYPTSLQYPAKATQPSTTQPGSTHLNLAQQSYPSSEETHGEGRVYHPL